MIKNVSVILSLMFIFFSITFEGVPVLSSIDTVLGTLIIGLFVILRLKNVSVPNLYLFALPFVILSFYAVREDFLDYLKVILVSIIWISSFMAISLLVYFEKEETVTLVFWTCCASLVLNITAYLLGFDSYWNYGGVQGTVLMETAFRRPSALLGNPNTFGMLAVSVLLLFYMMKRNSTALYLLVFSMCSYVAVLTASRKAVVLIFLLFMLHLFSKKISNVARFFNFTVLGLIIAIAPFIIINFRDELIILDRLLTVGQDGSSSERLMLFDESIEYIIESPFVGYGYGWFAENSSAMLYSHINYLELALSGGVFLLLSYYYLHVLGLFVGLMRGSLDLVSILLVVLVADSMMVSYDMNLTPLLVAFIAYYISYYFGNGLREKYCISN